MSLTVYGPNDQWPQHQKQYWRAALKQARDAGWSLHHLAAAHRFGVLRCPAGEHTVNVDQTARGAEAIAKEVPKRLRSCPHTESGPESAQARRRAQIEELLHTAERLIYGAETELARLEQSQEAWAELERIEMLLATAEVTLAEVRDEREQAWEAAAELDDVLTPDAIEGALERAEGASGQARTEATKIRRPAVVKALTQRMDAADERIASLRGRVRGL